MARRGGGISDHRPGGCIAERVLTADRFFGFTDKARSAVFGTNTVKKHMKRVSVTRVGRHRRRKCVERVRLRSCSHSRRAPIHLGIDI